jgi:hypothetical protein
MLSLIETWGRWILQHVLIPHSLASINVEMWWCWKQFYWFEVETWTVVFLLVSNRRKCSDVQKETGIEPQWTLKLVRKTDCHTSTTLKSQSIYNHWHNLWRRCVGRIRWVEPCTYQRSWSCFHNHWTNGDWNLRFLEISSCHWHCADLPVIIESCKARLTSTARGLESPRASKARI